MGIGIAQHLPVVLYGLCWVMCLYALFGRPLYTLYFLTPLLPYQTFREHFNDLPLGSSMMTLLVLSVIVGAMIHGKKLPPNNLYKIWLIFGIYLYFSLWFGTLMGNAPAPLWLGDLNFVTWKDYMLIPLVFAAAGMVLEDRKSIRTLIIIAAITMIVIDKAALQSSLSHTFNHFDENKRDGGPLGYAGSNGLAAFLAQFAIFFWGVTTFVKTRKFKLIGYGLAGITMFATMYTFSRASYIALIVGALVIGVLKQRMVLPVIALFLVTWQAVVPTAVTERINMTHDANGKLEASAEERVRLWDAAETSILHDPIFGDGYATFRLKGHVDGLRDTHNWYILVMIETGLVGMIFALLLLQQMISISYRLFRRSEDPLYKGLGLGLLSMTLTSMVLNCFGDRWTYLEISGLVWVLFGAATRIPYLQESVVEAKVGTIDRAESVNSYLVMR